MDDTFLDKHEEKINEIEFNKLFMLGYYQSEKYFHKNRNLIIKELYPSIPQDTKYIKLSEKISKNNSIAIGVRMHENIDTEFGIRISDKRKARMIAGIGGITPISFYLNAINKMSDKVKDPKFFFIFNKKNNLDSLIQKSEILQNSPLEIVTADCGFENAYDNLWLMSKFSNFIISNSTLYWWAAYFSMLNSNSNHVICSKRFPNKDIYINEWENQNKHFISIIIPTYKRPIYLKKILTCLISNYLNFKFFEVIICDSDKSLRNKLIINEFKKRLFKISYFNLDRNNHSQKKKFRD